jgi:hypothetical protein
VTGVPTAPPADSPSPERGTPTDVQTVAAAGSGLGAALLAAVAGTCCVGPVVGPIFVSVLGASGAARAAGLKGYSPHLLLGSLLLLAYGYWSVYRRRRLCAAGVCGPSPRPVRLMLWVASALWVVSAAINVGARVAG